ncbi:hypothetical protein C0J52_15476 [Blattella germanica]|nr:hypothetical protein C0J52_15476 [Blattella germanica]
MECVVLHVLAPVRLPAARVFTVCSLGSCQGERATLAQSVLSDSATGEERCHHAQEGEAHDVRHGDHPGGTGSATLGTRYLFLSVLLLYISKYSDNIFSSVELLVVIFSSIQMCPCYLLVNYFEFVYKAISSVYSLKFLVPERDHCDL